MATRKGVLRLSHEELAIVASFETERLEAHRIEDVPEILPWDPEGDRPVVRQRYVKPTHETIEGEPALPEGTVGYRYVDEDGREVPSESLVYVQRTPAGKVERVEKRPSTVLKGQPVPVERWIDRAQVEGFLVEATYELWGQELTDEAELQRLAEWIDANDETPMLVWMLQPDFLKTWGVLLPEIDRRGKRFTLLVKTFRKRVEPEHPMPMLTKKAVDDLIKQAETRFVDQPAPA